LDNLNIRHFFKAIVSADDVATSKPDPKTFIECARLLKVAPQNCIVFEDAPKGIEAAQNAGMKAFVLTTMYPKNKFVSYKNIIGFSENYASFRPFDFIYKNEKVLNNNLSVKPTLI
jgi:beta-phosphoglucomutase-like phosphatase (HAD superfamily)